MQMQMTNAEMVAYIEQLSALTGEKGKLGYAIARNLRLLRTAATEYIELRSKLFERYGKPVEGSPGSVTVPAEDVEKFLGELGDIPQISHEVDVYTVCEEVFVGGSLTAQQMGDLMWMVTEDDAG